MLLLFNIGIFGARILLSVHSRFSSPYTYFELIVEALAIFHQLIVDSREVSYVYQVLATRCCKVDVRTCREITGTLLHPVR